MTVALPLDKMNILEKLSIMEVLWDDICRNAPDFASPSWHGDVLKAREQGIENGSDKFEDWDKAKKDIWKSVS